MRISRPAISFGAVLAMFLSPVAGANIVQNPGFEDASLDFWTTNAPGDFPFHLAIGGAHSGTNFAVNGACAFGCLSEITQTLATTPGTKYELSFFAYTQNSNNANPQVSVLWGGSTVFAQNILATIAGPYVQYSVPGLTAAGANTPLEFTVAAAGVLNLDDVSVSPVPVPAAVWLLGPALGSLGFMRRRSG